MERVGDFGFGKNGEGSWGESWRVCGKERRIGEVVLIEVVGVVRQESVAMGTRDGIMDTRRHVTAPLELQKAPRACASASAPRPSGGKLRPWSLSALFIHAVKRDGEEDGVIKTDISLPLDCPHFSNWPTAHRPLPTPRHRCPSPGANLAYPSRTTPISQHRHSRMRCPPCNLPCADPPIRASELNPRSQCPSRSLNDII